MTALETLYEIAESTPIKFTALGFTEESYKKAMKIAKTQSSGHNEITKICHTACMIFTTQMFSVGKHDSESSKFIEKAVSFSQEIIPLVLNHIESSPKREHCFSLLYDLEKFMKIVGPDLIVTSKTLIKSILETTFKCLSVKCLSQISSVDEDSDENNRDDLVEENESLIAEYSCNILKNIYNYIDFEYKKSIWLEVYPVLKDRLLNESHLYCHSLIVDLLRELLGGENFGFREFVWESFGEGEKGFMERIECL